MYSAASLCLVFLKIEMIASISALILKVATCFLSCLACQIYFSPVASRHTVANIICFDISHLKSSFNADSGERSGTEVWAYPRRARPAIIDFGQEKNAWTWSSTSCRQSGQRPWLGPAKPNLVTLSWVGRSP